MHDMEIAVKWSKQGHLKSVSTLRKVDQVGPTITYYADGSPKLFLPSKGDTASGCAVGTKVGWIDTGEFLCESYVSPNFPDAIFSRSIVEPVVQIVHAGNRWWAHANDPALPSEYCPEDSKRIQLIDAAAELAFVPATADFEGMWIQKHANGTLAYYGEFDYDSLRDGLTLTFWENGVLRTAATWRFGGIIGTRSCFSPSADLLAEQNFAMTGWSDGNWVTRYFERSKGTASLKRVKIFQGFELFKQLDHPQIRSILDEASFNRYVDPLYNSLHEVQPDSGDEWRLGASVDWSKYY